MKVFYYQQDISYCFFELGMVLLQLPDYSGGHSFGFYLNNVDPMKDTVAIWKLKHKNYNHTPCSTS